MEKYNVIETEKLKEMMEQLASIYDEVRLVEPKSASVVKIEGNTIQKGEANSCFSIWNAEKRCENCSSLSACEQAGKKAKTECLGDWNYHIISVPYLVSAEKEQYLLALELISKYQNDTHSQTKEPIFLGDEEKTRKELYEDRLTGALNRRYFEEDMYIYEMVRSLPRRIGYILVDVNHMNQINETYGGACGDLVLKQISNALSRQIRQADKLIRVGGDRFLLVFRDCRVTIIRKKIGTIRTAVEQLYIEGIGCNHISVALGMAYTEVFDGTKEQILELYYQAEAQLEEDRKRCGDGKSKSSKKQIGNEKKVILIVSETAQNRHLISVRFHGEYEILEACNGKAAIAILEQTKVDLVITDISMDMMDGYELIGNIRSAMHMYDLPVIAIAENDNVSQLKAMQAGANHFITRPFKMQSLSTLIYRLTRKSLGRQDLVDTDYIINSIPGAVVVYKMKMDGVEIQYCSKGIKELSGWDVNEFYDLLKNDPSAGTYPIDVDRVVAAFQKTAATLADIDIIYRAIHKNGSIRWIWMQGHVIGQEDGCPILETILLNISDFSFMDLKLLNITSMIVMVSDMETHEILYANDAAISFQDNGEQDYQGKKCYDFIFGCKQPCSFCQMGSAQEECYNYAEREYGGRNYRTRSRIIDWYGRRAFAEVAEDITEEKKIQEYQQELAVTRAANQAKSKFLSTVSHDMRTPLNTIINLATLSCDDFDDKKKLTEDMDKIEIAGSFLLGLINDVLDMSKIESGNMTLKPVVYHYSEFINYVNGIIVPLCIEKDLEFVWEKGCTNVDLWVDKTRFNQIFFNLLSNAVKYTPAGGKVGFEVKNGVIEDGKLKCDYIIWDTGIGISKEFLPKIFLPFERANKVDAYKGTGLGMPITKSILDIMGGTIAIESEPDKGTRITVHLDIPLATQKQAEDSIQESRLLHEKLEPPKNADTRILVVEDHPLNQEIVKRLLIRQGYQYECVNNGKEAVLKMAECEAWTYALILMDIRMPVMDGLEATRQIRQLSGDYAKQVPIVAMTANAYDADAKNSIEAGMNEHLSKPIIPNQLYETLAIYCNHRR